MREPSFSVDLTISQGVLFAVVKQTATMLCLLTAVLPLKPKAQPELLLLLPRVSSFSLHPSGCSAWNRAVQTSGTCTHTHTPLVSSLSIVSRTVRRIRTQDTCSGHTRLIVRSSPMGCVVVNGHSVARPNAGPSNPDPIRLLFWFFLSSSPFFPRRWGNLTCLRSVLMRTNKILSGVGDIPQSQQGQGFLMLPLPDACLSPTWGGATAGLSL